MTRATRILWLMHLLGNALLLWCAYYWLSVGESSIARLAWSATLAVLMVAAAVWLHGTGFAFFRTDRSTIGPAMRTALRTLLPLFVLAVVAMVLYWLLAWWRDYSAQPSFKIASYLTLKLRKPVKPATPQAVFNAVLWVVRWAIVPIVLLPVASSIASQGWGGFLGAGWKRSRQWKYWIQVVLLVLAGVWLPLHLITWVPWFASFGMQMTSFLVRLLIAYLLFVASWLRIEQVS